MKKADKKPALVIGGQQHRKATSFTPEKIEQTDRAKFYRDQGIIWMSPTRGVVHTNVVISWLSLMWPMNQFRSPLIATEGMEVAAAYNEMVKASMSREMLRKAFAKPYADAFADAPFILTTEEDNVLPGDAVIRLLAAIHKCPDCGGEVSGSKWKCEKGHRGFDAVSGLYFVKNDPPTPQAWGTPNGKKEPDFRPRSVKRAIEKGQTLEVNGIGMGCAIWRKDLFRRVRKPWFKTAPTFTQDLYFAKKAKKEARARFGVDCSVRVAHYDPVSKQLF